MGGNIKVYTPGRSGVNVDTDPFLLQDDELQVAENCYHDPTNKHGGALRKRRGLLKFNSVAAGGVILGGITMAVAGAGGAAAATGTGLTGDDAGSGDGTGAPGATLDGASISYPAPGSAIFGGGALFAGARIIAVGRDNNASGDNRGIGWYVTSKGFADTALAVTTPGPPGGNYHLPSVLFPNTHGLPMAFVESTGYLYYAAAHDQIISAGTSAVATIRKTNGGIDTLVATIPGATVAAAFSNGNVSTGQNRVVINWLHLGYDGYIYVAVQDKVGGSDGAGNYGRVFKMSLSGSLTELPQNSATTGVPYCVAYFNGHVYWGDFLKNSSGAVSATLTQASITRVSSDLLLAVTDFGPSIGTTAGAVVTSMCVFPKDDIDNQCLFVGLGVASADYVSVWVSVRRSTPSPWASSLTATGGAATSGNHFSSLVEFNDKLYGCWYNTTNLAKIYEFTPTLSSVDTDGGWDGTGTWATVLTDSSGVEPYVLHVDDGVIYAISGVGGGVVRAYSSTDGAVWTNRDANFSDFGSASYPLPIFMGVDQ